MKPKWLLIAYDSPKPLQPSGQDTVFVLDAGSAQKDIIEIFIFNGSIRKEGLDKIRANVKGSHFRDGGFLFYPTKRHEQIKDIFLDIFDNISFHELGDLESIELAQRYTDKLINLTKGPVESESIRYRTYEVKEEDTQMDISLLENVKEFMNEYEKIPDDAQHSLLSSIQEILNELSPSSDRIRRLFYRMSKIADKITSNSELEEVLETILEGVLQTFGDEPLAAAICGFDESKPHYYEFDHNTYIVKGRDRQQRKFMENPPRHGVKIHPIDNKEYPGTASAVMDRQRYAIPSQRAKYINDVIRYWPKWMPPLRDPKDPKLASTAYLPLIVGEQRVGIIILQFSEHHTFTRDEKSELDLYAKTASSALYNTQLQKELKDSLDGVRKLQALSNKALGSLDISWIAQEISELLLEQKDYSAVVVRICPQFFEDNGHMFFISQNSEIQSNIPESFSHLGWPIKFWDKNTAQRIDQQIQDKDWGLGYALELSNRTFGLLLVVKTTEKGGFDISPFSEQEKRWLRFICRQTSIILADLGRRNRMNQKSQSITQLVTLISDGPNISIDELWGFVADKLVHGFHLHDFYIATCESDTNEIKYQLMYRDTESIDVSTIKTLKRGKLMSLLDQVFLSGESLLISNNVLAMAQELQIKLDPSARLPKCFIGVPLNNNEKIIGVLAAQDFYAENSFHASDKSMFETIASLIVLAMNYINIE